MEAAPDSFESRDDGLDDVPGVLKQYEATLRFLSDMLYEPDMPLPAKEVPPNHELET